jgi:hypothetical protein
MLACGVEVFCLRPDLRRLTVPEKTEADETFDRRIDELIADGVVVGRASTWPAWREPKVIS